MDSHTFHTGSCACFASSAAWCTSQAGWSLGLERKMQVSDWPLFVFQFALSLATVALRVRTVLSAPLFFLLHDRGVPLPSRDSDSFRQQCGLMLRHLKGSSGSQEAPQQTTQGVGWHLPHKHGALQRLPLPWSPSLLIWRIPRCHGQALSMGQAPVAVACGVADLSISQRQNLLAMIASWPRMAFRTTTSSMSTRL